MTAAVALACLGACVAAPTARATSTIVFPSSHAGDASSRVFAAAKHVRRVLVAAGVDTVAGLLAPVADADAAARALALPAGAADGVVERVFIAPLAEAAQLLPALAAQPGCLPPAGGEAFAVCVVRAGAVEARRGWWGVGRGGAPGGRAPSHCTGGAAVGACSAPLRWCRAWGRWRRRVWVQQPPPNRFGPLSDPLARRRVRHPLPRPRAARASSRMRTHTGAGRVG